MKVGGLSKSKAYILFRQNISLYDECIEIVIINIFLVLKLYQPQDSSIIYF
jgi:hypothetical protein